MWWSSWFLFVFSPKYISLHVDNPKRCIFVYTRVHSRIR
jgi:hypothetical protein